MPGRLELLRQTFPGLASFLYVSELSRALEGCRLVLDVGCGARSPIRHIPGTKIGMDAYVPAIEGARATRTHDFFLVAEARMIASLFQEKSIDALVALDLIEHLTEEEGRNFLEAAERIARKRVVIFTPNGFLPQGGQDDDLQEHLSGWTSQAFKGAGYRVVGIGGPKRLRGEYHETRVRPRAVGAIMSAVGHLAFTRNHPDAASALLAVKELSQ